MSVKNAVDGINAKLVRGLNARAEALRAEIYGVLEESRIGTGRVYTRRGKRHQASAPGEPPARDTGRLMESIAVLSRATPNELVSTVGPREAAFKKRAPYPVFLEFGTRRMKPRPFMRPALERFRQKIKGVIARWPGGEP